MYPYKLSRYRSHLHTPHYETYAWYRLYLRRQIGTPAVNVEKGDKILVDGKNLTFYGTQTLQVLSSFCAHLCTYICSPLR